VEATETIGGERILRGGPGPEPGMEAAASSGERPASRQVAKSDVSIGSNLRGFLIALLFAFLVLLASAALGLLIATTFYGYAGLG
jgi:hypothetical protein